ncbi:MAG: stage II sporulation protein M [Anaerotignum sp.]|nr:stage II sporulation protein M [Anaerotignum sp.]
MDMRKKRGTDRQVQKVIGIVCLSFLLGNIGGALAANLLPAGEQGELSLFLQGMTEGSQVSSFGALFWKYLKYDLVIWLGGWMQMGLFISGMTFLFRGVSLGFTSAMLLNVYGVRGIGMVITSLLPQNILLIPAYILMMSAALYYMLHWKEEGGKRALKRERRRRQTEYCILFAISVVLLAGAVVVERMVLLA